jgi:hypothetical protein
MHPRLASRFRPAPSQKSGYSTNRSRPATPPPGKAKRRLSQFVAHAGVLVLAIHSEDVIREMCNKAVLMEHGWVASAGSLGTVMFSLKATQ